MRAFLLFFIFVSVHAGCRKNNETGSKAVEIYLLQSYTQTAGKCAVDASTAVWEPQPVLDNDDIVGYSKKEHYFLLTAEAYERAKSFSDWRGFVVTVDKEVAYYGIYKPGISSSSCDGSITMDGFAGGGPWLYIRNGYPGSADVALWNDPRNSGSLFAALDAQHKLF